MSGISARQISGLWFAIDLRHQFFEALLKRNVPKSYRRLKKRSEQLNFPHSGKTEERYFRDHPLMSRYGVPIWHPVWTWVDGLETHTGEFEVALLLALGLNA